MAWESTAKRCTLEFFAAPYGLRAGTGGATTSSKMAGRLTHPMRYDAGERPLSPDRLERGLRAHRAASQRAARSEHGRVLHLRPAPRTRRLSSISSSCVRYGTNNFPDCSNMCHEATSVGLPKVDRGREGHGATGGFRQDRLHLHLRTEPRHQQPAHDDQPARRLAARRDHHVVQPFPRAGAGTLPGASKSCRDGDVLVDADQLAALSGTRRRRRRRPEGPDEVPRRRGRARARRRSALVLDWDFITGHTIGNRGAARRPGGDGLGGHRAPVRPAPRRDRGGRMRLHEGRAGDRGLRHGHHPAPPRLGGRAAARKPLLAEGQHRPGRGRPLPGAWPLQRSG